MSETKLSATTHVEQPRMASCFLLVWMELEHDDGWALVADSASFHTCGPGSIVNHSGGQMPVLVIQARGRDYDRALTNACVQLDSLAELDEAYQHVVDLLQDKDAEQFNHRRQR